MCVDGTCVTSTPTATPTLTTTATAAAATAAIARSTPDAPRYQASDVLAVLLPALVLLLRWRTRRAAR